MGAGHIAESDAAAVAVATTPASRQAAAWRRSIYLTAPVVLLLPFLIRNRWFDLLLYALVYSLGVPRNDRYDVLDLVVRATLVLLFLLAVRFWERRSFRSVGIRMPRVMDLVVGIAGFLAIGWLDQVWAPIVRPLTGAAPAADKLAALLNSPGWYLAGGAIGTALIEELYFRAYAVERFGEITGSLLVGAGIGLLIDLYAHVDYWGWKYVLAISASQAFFAALYLWRRNVAPCVIAHFLCDAPKFFWYPVGLILMFVIPAIVNRLPPRLVPSYVYQVTAYGMILNKDSQGAIEMLSLALNKNPKDAYALHARAYAYYQNSDYGHAISDLNHAVALRPRDADTISFRGDAYYMEHKCDSAIDDYKRALMIDPKIEGAWEFMGECLNQREQYWVASASLWHAVTLEPGNAGAWYWLADADIGTGFYPAAIDDYDHIIAIDPSDGTAYLKRGNTFQTMSDYGRALSDYREAMRTSPEQPDAYNAAAWLLATCPEDQLRDGKQAVTLALRACELSRWKDGEMLDTLAAAHAEAGQFDQAIEWERQAIPLMPESERAEARGRLDLYRQDVPYREEASPKGTSNGARIWPIDVIAPHRSERVFY
jgi:tetratricopeptide (TPR) repeat protein